MFAPQNKEVTKACILPFAKLSRLKDTSVRKMWQSPCEVSGLVVVAAAMVL
jgi:hypothetical protein